MNSTGGTSSSLDAPFLSPASTPPDGWLLRSGHQVRPQPMIIALRRLSD